MWPVFHNKLTAKY